jgi:hypothetical protein
MWLQAFYLKALGHPDLHNGLLHEKKFTAMEKTGEVITIKAIGLTNLLLFSLRYLFMVRRGWTTSSRIV